MICFNYGRPEKDGTYTERIKYGMISVIIHEVGHFYFPMIVNSDERQWTWMDEGLNTYLQFITEQSGDCFIPRGVNVSALDITKTWEFQHPKGGDNKRYKVGDHISAGDIFGVVPENVLISHKIMLPPNAKGKITYLAEEGEYDLREKVIEVEFNGEKKEFTMLQQWPVRAPRPTAEKLAANHPLLTGQRV